MQMKQPCSLSLTPSWHGWLAGLREAALRNFLYFYYLFYVVFLVPFVWADAFFSLNIALQDCLTFVFCSFWIFCQLLVFSAYWVLLKITQSVLYFKNFHAVFLCFEISSLPAVFCQFQLCWPESLWIYSISYWWQNGFLSCRSRLMAVESPGVDDLLKLVAGLHRFKNDKKLKTDQSVTKHCACSEYRLSDSPPVSRSYDIYSPPLAVKVNVTLNFSESSSESGHCEVWQCGLCL